VAAFLVSRPRLQGGFAADEREHRNLRLKTELFAPFLNMRLKFVSSIFG